MKRKYKFFTCDTYSWKRILTAHLALRKIFIPPKLLLGWCTKKTVSLFWKMCASCQRTFGESSLSKLMSFHSWEFSTILVFATMLHSIAWYKNASVVVHKRLLICIWISYMSHCAALFSLSWIISRHNVAYICKSKAFGKIDTFQNERKNLLTNILNVNVEVRVGDTKTFFINAM